MNGYEQLPLFAGYHQSGFDNWVRFKNMGLKVRWHPTQRVYHPWHPMPDADFGRRDEQKLFIARRAATWDVLAYEGLDPSRNRPYDPEAMPQTDWANIMTERGLYRPADGVVFEARPQGGQAPQRGGLRRRLRKLLGRGES
jgi:hypothetical protein